MRFWRILLWISIVVLLFAALLPLLKMLFVSMATWTHDGISIDILTHSSLLRTLIFALLVAFFSTAIGMLLALLFAKTDLPFGALWMTLLSMPLQKK